MDLEKTIKSVEDLTRHAFGAKKRLIFGSVDENNHIRIEVEGTPIAESRPTVHRTLAALTAQVALIRCEGIKREQAKLAADLAQLEALVATSQAIADAEPPVVVAVAEADKPAEAPAA